MDKRALLDAVPKLAGRRVAVIGDLFLDDYIVGRAERLSREAPLPVLEYARRFQLPGGACNPAMNIAALGSSAYQVGVVGDDAAGQALLARLQQAGIDTSHMVVDPGRRTTTKTRIMAEGTLLYPQQVARVDWMDRAPLGPAFTQKLREHIQDLAAEVDAFLLSDYKGGVVSEDLIASAVRSAREAGKYITVDSQGDLHKFRGFHLLKCNRREAEIAAGHPLNSEEDFEALGRSLLRDLGAGAVLITRGPEGMSLIMKKQAHHLPAANRSEVFDVSGAGDTVIAVTTLSLAAGLDLVKAAHLANYAAGLVVRKMGNATPTPQELAWAIKNWL
ncbi:MAG: bifunctional hydroxymethylpyrimidine kinase/phosphomethylpyrimidine kinase [Chloroflexi bacterium]|nr:bifunctional hydroxymethylpyrimidine kinase/phosphomethylpyrimidine kinase [Chloroflexota bacterium]